jgi:hypothetical protein
MAQAKERFTAYLSAAEYKAIRDKADEQGTSMNWIVRTVIREAFGLSGRSGVPLVTRNNSDT